MHEKLSELPSKVLSTIKGGAEAFRTLCESGNFNHIVIKNIDCYTLPEPSVIKGYSHPPELNYIWDKLPPKENPCIYYFEILSPDADTILKSYTNFKKDIRFTERSSPALRKYPDLATTVLYVGKVKKGIVGRIEVHLGYYHVGHTNGLQLCYWAKDIKVKLSLHVFSFEKNMQNFVDSLELPFANSLKPLIGKH
jgi:hypothetical protein